MSLPKSDWLKDTNWTEYHLTASEGWVTGTNRTEKGRYEVVVVRPPDCVLTLRYLSVIPADPTKKVSQATVIHWRSPNTEAINAAQREWGIMARLPPVSGAIADNHRDLKYIRYMTQDLSNRPCGRKEQVPRYNRDTRPNFRD